MKVVKYEVYNQKGVWMGGYSKELEIINPSFNALEMAHQNAAQCKGKIVAILEDGSQKDLKIKK